MNTDSENSYIFFTQALDYVQRKCCHENTRPAEKSSAVVIFSWAPSSSSSINHHSALISDTIINKKKNNNNSAYPNTERPVGHTVSLSRRSVCGNVCNYFPVFLSIKSSTTTTTTSTSTSSVTSSRSSRVRKINGNNRSNRRNISKSRNNSSWKVT